MDVKLVVVGGEEDGTEFPISTPMFVIGRGEKCHIRPECKFVNRVHCQILVDEDKDTVAIEDCSGAVGTFVNGEKIKWRTFLEHGDRIKVGTLELEVQFAAEERRARKTWEHGVASADEGDEKIVQWVKDGQDLRSLTPAMMAAAAADQESIAAGTSPELVKRAGLIKRIKMTAARINARLVKMSGIQLLLLVVIPLSLIVVLGMLIPTKAKWYSDIASSITSSISTALHPFWLECQKVWYQPVWPWWVPALMFVACALVLLMLIKIRNRLQRRGKT